MDLHQDLSEIWSSSKSEEANSNLSLNEIFAADWRTDNEITNVITANVQLCPLPRPCPLKEDCGCVHSVDELAQRKSWRKTAKVKKLEELPSEIVRLRGEENVRRDQLVEIIGNVSIHCDQNLYIMHLDKCKQFKWKFTIKPVELADVSIKHVFLLEQDFPEFKLESVAVGDMYAQVLPEGCQHWNCDIKSKDLLRGKDYTVVIGFYSEHFGNFDQKVIFQFDNSEKVFRNVGVQVAHESTLMQTLQYRPLTKPENELTWIQTHRVIPFDGQSEINYHSYKYLLPPNIGNLIQFGAFDHLDKILTRDNYRERLHTLLYIEEYQRRKNLERLSFTVENLEDFLSSPVPGVNKNKIVRLPFDDYLIAEIYSTFGKSGKALVRIRCPQPDTIDAKDYTVYEVVVERLVGNEIIVELSSELDKFMTQNPGSICAEICFRFVDTFQYMHKAVDAINVSSVFPEDCERSSFSWLTYKEAGLSKEQSAAFQQMITPESSLPILLLGPFGSGKTRTMATAILSLLKEAASDSKNQQKGRMNRILICTHSNSAADHYIEDFIHPFLQTQHIDKSFKPLRINWEYRYSSSVSDIVLHYCLYDKGRFMYPDINTLKGHRIIVCTLVTADILCSLNLPSDFFSHIFIDEAAQAMEVEAIIPLALATSKTKLVLAGDHLQLGPRLSSDTARKLGLGTSLLERLFQLYPADCPYKLKLLENYRSFVDIVEISSVLFYEGTLQCNCKRPDGVDYPVHFYGIHGTEDISESHPSYWNQAEATEVLHRLQDLENTWPGVLNKLELHRICVLAFYSAQIQEIRLLLRKNGFSSVRVDTVNNVQGLEFDVIIISTVRSYNETTIYEAHNGTDLGFLTNPKLLNTAMTRAKYMCIFIGEPVGLCSIGESKPCWKAILATCQDKGTFHYRLPFDRVVQMVEGLKQVSEKDEDTICGFQSTTSRETLSSRNVEKNEAPAKSKAGRNCVTTGNSSKLKLPDNESKPSDVSKLDDKSAEIRIYSGSSASKSSNQSFEVKGHGEYFKSPRSQATSQIGICRPIPKTTPIREESRTPSMQNPEAVGTDGCMTNSAPITILSASTMERQLTDTTTSQHASAVLQTGLVGPYPVMQHTPSAQFAAFPAPSEVAYLSGRPFRMAPIAVHPLVFHGPRRSHHGMRMMGARPTMPWPWQRQTVPGVQPAQFHASNCPIFPESNDANTFPPYQHSSIYGHRHIPHFTTPLFSYKVQTHSQSISHIPRFFAPHLPYLSSSEIRPPPVHFHGRIFGARIPTVYPGFYHRFRLYNSESVVSTSENILSSMILKAGVRIRFMSSFFYFSLESMSDAYLDCPSLQADIEEVRFEYDSLVKNCNKYDKAYAEQKVADLFYRSGDLTQQMEVRLTTFLTSQYSAGHDITSQTQVYESLSRMLSELRVNLEHRLFQFQEDGTITHSIDSILSSQNPVALKILEMQHYISSLSQQLRSCRSSLTAENFSSHFFLVQPTLDFISKEIEICMAEISSVCGEEEPSDSSQSACRTLTNNESITDELHPYSVPEESEERDESFDIGFSDLIALTEESTPDVVEQKSGEIIDRIRELRLSDEDVDQWFVNRQNDPFVQEYITAFERRLAGRLPSPILGEPAGDKCLSLYRIYPSYTPYVNLADIGGQSRETLVEGTIYYETNKHVDEPHGVVLLADNIKLHFYGLRNCNRALMGDKVLAKFTAYNPLSEPCGKVLTVMERGRWSTLCRPSSLDEKLMFPHDNKGPPILVLPLPKIAHDAEHRSLGPPSDSVPNEAFIVKIMGWPVEMKYPIGVIEKKLADTIV